MPLGFAMRSLGISFGSLLLGVALGACEVVGGIHERTYREPSSAGLDGTLAGGAGAMAGQAGLLSGDATVPAGGGGTAQVGAGGTGGLNGGHGDAGGGSSGSSGLDVHQADSGSSTPHPSDAGYRDVNAGDVQTGCVPGGAEDCTDGVDNNCDGLVDCADPTCRSAGYECIQVPAGWAGPTAIWTGNPGSAPDHCGPGFEVALASLYREPSASPASCHCSCGAPTSQNCNAVTVTFYSNDVCGDPFATASAPAGSCQTIAYTRAGGAAFTASVSSTLPSGGTCAPEVTASIPKATWATELRVCSPAGSGGALGCPSADQRCLSTPNPQAPYRTGLCVYRVGDPPATACPAGYGVGPLVFYGDLSDTRACSACTCGPPTGGACSGTLSIYYRPNCEDKAVPFDIEKGCQSKYVDRDTPNTIKSDLVVKDPGSCAVTSDAQPTGSIEGKGAVTVCCAS